MKAKDLMIGDWVLHNWGEEQPCKVMAILDEEEINVFFGEEVIDLNEGEFEPIPITDEFLKKNFEFVLKAHFDYFIVGKVIKNIPNYYKGVVDEIDFSYGIENRRDKFCFMRGETGMWWVCDIKYIHELQHALRLVGLSGVADSLKV